MADRVVDLMTGSVQTTDGSTVTIMTYPLPTNCIAIFEYEVRGLSTADDAIACLSVSAAKRVTGDAALVGGGGATGYQLSDSGLDGGGTPAQVTATVSGTDVLIRVRGVAGKTINWTGGLRILIQ